MDVDSIEFKRKFDQLAQSKGLSFEDFYLEPGTKKLEFTHTYLILGIDKKGSDVDLKDLDMEGIVTVEMNDAFKKMSLKKGDKIKATIISIADKNGMSSAWNFKRIERV